MSSTGMTTGVFPVGLGLMAPKLDLSKCICHLAYVAEAGVAKILEGRVACRVHNNIQTESVVSRELPQEKKL
jgi:hypothetical protein